MNSENTWIGMTQEVGLLSSERLLVAGDMNGHVGKERTEYEDYMEVMESER